MQLFISAVCFAQQERSMMNFLMPQISSKQLSHHASLVHMCHFKPISMC